MKKSYPSRNFSRRRNEPNHSQPFVDNNASESTEYLTDELHPNNALPVSENNDTIVKDERDIGAASSTQNSAEYNRTKKNNFKYNDRSSLQGAKYFNRNTHRNKNFVEKDSFKSSRESYSKNSFVENEAAYNNSQNSPKHTDSNIHKDNTRGRVVNGRYLRPNVSSRRYSGRTRDEGSSEIKDNQNQLYQDLSNDNISEVSDSSFNMPRRHENTRGSHHYQNNYKNFSSREKLYGSYGEVPYNQRSSENVYHQEYKKNYQFEKVDRNYETQNNRNLIHDPKGKQRTSDKFRESQSKKEEKATQRDRLIQQLQKGECECMVCCEPIRINDYTWSCTSCYHVYHLKCIRKWARSPVATAEGEDEWRCPACQNKTKQIPYNYYCFCGKRKNPDINYHYIPHSCGEVCGKKRDGNCPHPCNLLCHPGPCPPCTATVVKSCECGKTSKRVPCNQLIPTTCSLTCDKVLNCGLHRCLDLCHEGSCQSCKVTYTQECYCKKNTREKFCDKDNSENVSYSCGMPCNKRLNCDHHQCSLICHPGSCNLCSLSIDKILTCPCGKTLLSDLYSAGKASPRETCIDPIPTCEEVCNKELICGPKDSPHKCAVKCHTEDCPPCPLVTNVKCRCGATTKEFLCAELSKQDFLCEKRCNKRKNCGRHKCLNHCCINLEHRCELQCNKKLSCGLHNCQETCHMGNCPTCWNVSFDELRCHCGTTVIYPPVPCGSKPPECNQPCARQHSCEHKVQHSCHSDERCPPCTALTVKLCFGEHEQRASVQCYLDGISCGKPCGKPLPCGAHTCQKICHSGPCLKEEEKCKQLCTKPRPLCNHPCAAVCHEGECPDIPCRAKMNVTCPCGHRSENITCTENSKSYRLLSVSVLASKIQDIKAGESVNINDVLGKKYKNNKLQCNEECAIIERNKRLAVALQIKNPDLSCKPGPPEYSEFLKEEAKKNPKFVEQIYNKLTELVLLAKESKQKSRSHAFPPMKREQRRVVHELAEFFGCDTQSYDEEPVKNVVVTAFREKSWLPFGSIMTVIERDMKTRRGPTPVVTYNKQPNTDKKEPVKDYFDYT